jgi:hypothetical protein
MLRLCYELNRYSTDLDFWFIKKVDFKRYFARIMECLKKAYDVPDVTVKFHTLFLEVRSKNYPRRLERRSGKSRLVAGLR